MKKTRIIVRVAIVCLLVLAGSIIWSRQRAAAPKPSEVSQSAEPAAVEGTQVGGEIQQFSDSELQALYGDVNYPNTLGVVTPPSITGNAAADERIRNLATARGYELKSLPQTNLIKVKNITLQQKAVQPWLDLHQAAQAAGIKLDAVSGFRSIDEQRVLFVSRLGAPADRIAAGSADTNVNKTLSLTAPPGYSRHHTGFTLDLVCNGSNSNFKNSTCNQWLATNNYANAKQFGWIPSYPEAADQQGPEPEAWEYVWVGTQTLTE